MRHMNMRFSREPDYFVQSELDRLRVSLGFTGAERTAFMICSSEPGEGKSYIAMNLWRDLARGGKRVCFVDADMRKSNLRVDFNLAPSEGEFLGLSHFLSGQAPLQDVIYETDEPNAYIIPTVTHINPSIMLDGDTFRNLLTALRGRFDYLIIDSPPLGIVSDGQRIAGMVDGTILAVRAHQTRREMVKSSIAKLENIGAPFLGVVLNRVDENRTKSYYSKAYYGNRYYSNSGSRNTSGRKRKEEKSDRSSKKNTWKTDENKGADDLNEES